MRRTQIWETLKKHRQLLPLILLKAYCVGAVVSAIRGSVVMLGRTFDYSLTPKHYIAFAVVTANSLVYFLFRRFYKYILALTIVVGLFNLITFSALETTVGYAIGFSANKLEISFQPSAFLAGLLAYVINFRKVNSLITGVKKTKEANEKYEKALFAEETEKFRERYENYSNEELAGILAENRYAPAALEAAKQLLNERQKMSSH